MPTVIPDAGENAGRKTNSGFRLTGLHVLLMLVCFFGLVAGVNGVMIHFATSTFRGEVAKKPYEQGLVYNRQIQQARDQAELGWKVDGAVKRDASGKARIEVVARDANGSALTGLQVSATLAAPADKRLDHQTKLLEVRPGAYEGAVDAAKGAWDLGLSAARDGKTLFQSQNRITLE